MKNRIKTLVQITHSEIPPLHQSTEMLMACKKNYVTQVIEGHKKPGGVESRRGNEVHHVGSQYFSYCARKGVPMDLDAFDSLCKGPGPEAARILAGMRDSYQVDFAALFATEIRMSLDENFEPTDIVDELGGVTSDSGLPVCYSGTLDGLYMYREQNKIAVHDLKTHPRPFNPDETLQAKMYCAFVMKHFPWVEEVLFRLIFCRYKNLFRECIFTRADLPKLIEAIKAARERQKVIHLEYDEDKDIEATGNDGCCYCPLLSDRECPILRDNPNAQGEPSEWLSSSLVYSAYAKLNNARMKAWVQSTGRPIILKDYNQKAFTYGPVESESKVYPLFRASGKGIEMDNQGRPVMPIVELLTDYAYATPDDTEWMGKLVISGTKLNSALGAKKRAVIDQAVSDVADRVTKAPLKVSKPLDAVPDDEPEDGDDDSEWDNDNEF